MGRLTTLKPRVKTLGQTDGPRGWLAPDKRSTTERGYGWEWQQLRERILLRDHGLCLVCKAAGRVTLACEVDHLVNKAQGGTDAESNLQALCGACHKAKTAAEAGGEGSAWFLGVGS